VRLRSYRGEDFWESWDLGGGRGRQYGGMREKEREGYKVLAVRLMDFILHRLEDQFRIWRGAG